MNKMDGIKKKASPLESGSEVALGMEVFKLIWRWNLMCLWEQQPGRWVH